VHQFVSAPVDLFYTAGLAVVLLSLAGVLAGTWSLSRNLLFAVLCSTAFITCDWQLYGARAMYTAIGVLGLAAPLALLHRQFCLRAAGLAVVALLLTFIRPEFILSFYLLLAAAAVAVAADGIGLATGGGARAEMPRRAAFLAFYAAIGIAVCLAFRFPVLSGTERDFLAFGQHYARRWVAWNPAAHTGGMDWEAIVSSDLPGAKTEMQALWLYPGKVAPFILENVRDAGMRLYGMTRGLRVAPSILQGAAAAGLVVFGVGVARRVWWQGAEGERWRLAGDLALLVPFLLPALAAVVLVYPVERYLVLLLSAFLFIAARLVRGTSHGETAAAAVLSVILAATVEPAPAVQRPNLAAIDAMAGLRPISRMFEIGKGWCAYLRQPCARIGMFGVPPGKGLRSELEASNADAVLVSSDLVEYAAERKDKNFLDWLDNPPAGWSRHELPASLVLYLRE